MQHQLFLEPKVKGTSSKENEALVKLVIKKRCESRQRRRSWKTRLARTGTLLPNLPNPRRYCYSNHLLLGKKERHATSAILTNKSMMQRASKIKAIIVPLRNYNFLNSKKEEKTEKLVKVCLHSS